MPIAPVAASLPYHSFLGLGFGKRRGGRRGRPQEDRQGRGNGGKMIICAPSSKHGKKHSKMILSSYH